MKTYNINAKSRVILQVYSGNAMRLTLSGATAPSLIAFVCGTGL